MQLNSTMCLISGTLRSTPLPWLPVLSNIELPALRRKAATDNLVEKIVKHDSWPIQPDILIHHCYDWHPESRCGWTCNQLTSKVDGGITGSQNWSTPTFFQRVINTWNKLDSDIVCLSSLNIFKNHLERLHKDESFIGLFRSPWLQRPSQYPGEASSAKSSGKLTCSIV